MFILSTFNEESIVQGVSVIFILFVIGFIIWVAEEKK